MVCVVSGAGIAKKCAQHLQRAANRWDGGSPLMSWRGEREHALGKLARARAP